MSGQDGLLASDARRLADALIDAACKHGNEWDATIAYEIRSHMRSAVETLLAEHPATPAEPDACEVCGRSWDWSGPLAPGAPCMGCGRYPAARPAEPDAGDVGGLTEAERVTCLRCGRSETLDRRVADRERKAAERALREAADALGSQPRKPVLHERESCDWWGEERVDNWLRARADREAGR